MILLDTDVLSLYHVGHTRVLDRFRNVDVGEVVGTTIVSGVEILRGRFESLLKAADGQQLEGAQQRLDESETLQVNLTLPGGTTMSFDSSNPNKEEENPELQKFMGLFKANTETTTRLILDKNNDIQAVEFEGNPTESVDDIFKSQFDPALRKQISQQEFDKLPDEPVKPGDTWTRFSELDLGAGQSMTFETAYEYAGTVEKNGKTLDRITMETKKVTYALDPNGGLPLQLVKSELKVTTSTGEILFDRERGQIVSDVEELQIAGDIAFKVGDKDAEGTLELKINTDTKLQP